MTGRVAAIVSAYYAEKYLDGRIQNLLDQTEKPEIVIVTKQGSPCHKIAEKYPVRIVITENIPTIYEAWNIGIKAATAKYVTSANSDDRLAKRALETMADILDRESTYGLVYADVDIVKEVGGNPVGEYKWLEGTFEDLKRVCFVGPMPVWRKSLHEKFGYFDESFLVTGDYEMWLRFMSNGVKFYHYRGGNLGAYLKRETSAEHREPLRTIWETNRARGLYREAKC